MALGCLIWHRDDLAGLQRSLAALYRAWTLAQRDPALGNFGSFRIKVLDEGTPPPRDLEVARILEREAQVLPWKLEAVRVPVATTRESLWREEAKNAGDTDWLLSLEAGDEVSPNLLLEAARLLRHGDCVWRLPVRSDSALRWWAAHELALRWASQADLERGASLAFAWSGTMASARATRRLSASAIYPLQLPESWDLDLGFEYREKGFEVAAWRSSALERREPARPIALERRLRAFEEAVVVGLKRRRQGLRPFLGLVGVVFGLLLECARRGRWDQAPRIFRAWKRLRPLAK